MSGSGGFLRLWSRLKHGEVVAPAAGVQSATPPAEVPGAAASGDEEASDGGVGREGARTDMRVSDETLPPVESLDLAADFTAFMRKEVSEGLRRAALKKLFSDPHFNRMDGLDIYIDDYSIPDPIPDDVLKRMTQFETLFAEPETEDASESAPASPPDTVQAVASPPACDGAEGGSGQDNLSVDGQIVDGAGVVHSDVRNIKDSTGE